MRGVSKPEEAVGKLASVLELFLLNVFSSELGTKMQCMPMR